jgi:hypothetical protein
VLHPGARPTQCIAVMRGTLDLDRSQAVDPQSQTANQRVTVIGVAPPVRVVTLPVPFIIFFNT